MTAFIAAELSFDVPGEFRNRSLEAFVAPPGATRVSLSIAREPRDERDLTEQAEALLAELPAALPASRIIARRSRPIGALDGYEARVEARADGAALYQRIAFVSVYETLLVLTATGHAAQRSACDAIAERWLDSMRFRRR